MNPDRPKNVSSPLSVIILTYNEEANLPDCLDSLQGLHCQTIIVDSGSTDRTVAIAQAAGTTVVEHPFENYASQRNWAQQNLPLQSDWVLHLDADERLTPELVQEINQVLQESPHEVDGFLLCRRTIFRGRWIKKGGHYPSCHLRLFRKERGGCEDRLYDQHFLVNGRVRRLKHDYLNLITDDLDTWVSRHTRWAELEAQEIESNRKGGNRVRPAFFGNPIEKRRWLREGLYARLPLFLRAFLYWFYRYFLRLGFLDGKEGLVFHFLQGCWYRFLVDCKLEELRSKRARGQADRPARQAIGTSSSGVVYRSIKPPKKLKRVLYWGIALVLAVAAVFFFYAPLLRAVALPLLVADPLQRAAAIIVLSGEMPFRAAEAAELYRAGWAPKVVLTWGKQRWESQEMLENLGINIPWHWEVNRAVLVRNGVPPEAIVIATVQTGGTLEELRSVMRLLKPEDGPVILVTSKAHTRRVSLTWRYVAGSRWRAVVRPARKDPFDPTRWWQQRRFALELVREYLGLFNYWAGFPVPAPVSSRQSP